MMQDRIIGRKGIIQFFRDRGSMKGYRWNTVKGWKKERGMPMHCNFQGKPYIYAHEIDEWERQTVQGGREKPSWLRCGLAAITFGQEGVSPLQGAG